MKCKVNNNDANGVRRSSRRATIERRVWALPKKGNKFTSASSHSAKKKETTQSKKEKITVNDEKPVVRDNRGRMGSHGVKRGFSPMDEVEATQKKVKKKRNESGGVSKDKGEHSDISQNLCDQVKELNENDGFQCREECTKLDLDDGMKTDIENKVLGVDERTGSVLSEHLNDDNGEPVETSSIDKNGTAKKPDIGKEETLCVDDLSLHKAVIVQVVSDNKSSIVKESSLNNSMSSDINSDGVLTNQKPFNSSVIVEKPHDCSEKSNPKTSHTPVYKIHITQRKIESVGSLLSEVDKYPIKFGVGKGHKVFRLEPKPLLASRITSPNDISKKSLPETILNVNSSALPETILNVSTSSTSSLNVPPSPLRSDMNYVSNSDSHTDHCSYSYKLKAEKSQIEEPTIPIPYRSDINPVSDTDHCSYASKVKPEKSQIDETTSPSPNMCVSHLDANQSDEVLEDICESNSEEPILNGISLDDEVEEDCLEVAEEPDYAEGTEEPDYAEGTEEPDYAEGTEEPDYAEGTEEPKLVTIAPSNDMQNNFSRQLPVLRCQSTGQGGGLLGCGTQESELHFANSEYSKGELDPGGSEGNNMSTVCASNVDDSDDSTSPSCEESESASMSDLEDDGEKDENHLYPSTGVVLYGDSNSTEEEELLDEEEPSFKESITLQSKGESCNISTGVVLYGDSDSSDVERPLDKEAPNFKESIALQSKGEACNNDVPLQSLKIPKVDPDFRTVGGIKDVLDHSKGPPEQVQMGDAENKEDEEHVSLSVALAQLLDAGSTDEDDGAETLTIHSASAITQESNNGEEKGMLTVHCDLQDQSKDDHLNDDDIEEEEGKLFIKEDEEEEEDEDVSELGDGDDDKALFKEEEKKEEAVAMEEEECQLQQQHDQVDSEDQISPSSGNPKYVSEKSSDHAETASTPLPEKTSEKEGEPQPLNLHKPKKQLPPLIKISSRPPSIKTPLKCPECPMQFCTVRSLFWHFGLHGARSEEMCLPPILLQDLIVPWDKPSISVFLSQAQDILDKAEKSMHVQEDQVGETEKFSGDVNAKSSVSCPVLTTTTATAPHILSNGQSPITSSCDNTSTEKARSSLLHNSRTEETSGTNGDVILKIPIPRLKRKLQASSSSSSAKAEKFINILPKFASQKQIINRSKQSSVQSTSAKSINSLPQKVSFPPNTPLDVVTVTPQPPLMPKLTIMPTSSSQVQIQPLPTSTSLLTSQSVLSSQPVASTQSWQSSSSPASSSLSSSLLNLSIPSVSSSIKNSSTNQITLIPMDNISASANQQQQPTIAPVQSTQDKQLPSPVDGLVEKDGLVMINSNLALRIVSSLPSTLDTTTTTTNSTSFRPITNTSFNNLTILPQMDGDKNYSSFRDTAKNPDILTIVPQVDLSKRQSFLKNSASSGNTLSSTSSTTASTPSSTTSQVVKLYLLQSKDSSNQNATKIKIPDALRNLNGVEFKPLSILNGKENAKGSSSNNRVIGETSCDSEDEEKSMVIANIKEETEEDLMDPLSLCAVTMEDEHLDLSSHSSSASVLKIPKASVENDRASSDKGESKVRLKKEKLDIVKYEARKYVCCYCNRRFGWSTDLKRHVILHTGERPFQCKVCPTAFTRKFLLQNHMKRMHPDKCKMSDLWPH